MASNYIKYISVFRFAIFLMLCSSSIAYGQFGPRQEAEKHIQTGDNFLSSGDWNNALTYYTKAISIDRSYARAYMKRALVYRFLQRFQEANIDYQYALRINPYSEYIYNERAKLKMMAMDYKGAMEDISKAISLNPENTESRELQIDDLIALGRYDQALKVLDTIEYDQDSLGFLEPLKRTYICILKKDWDQAELNLDSVFNADTVLAVAYDLKGMLLFGQERYDESLEAYSKAISIDPDFAMAYYNRSLNYRAQGNQKKALEDLNKAIEISKNERNSFLARAVVKKEMGDMKGALEDYNQVLENNPEYSEALYNLAFTNKVLGNEAQAMIDAQELVAMDPDKAENWNLKGNVELLFGKYDDAIDSYTEAISLNLEYAEAYYNRGLAYYMSNRSQNGCLDVETSIQLGYKKAEQFQKYVCSD